MRAFYGCITVGPRMYVAFLARPLKNLVSEPEPRFFYLRVHAFFFIYIGAAAPMLPFLKILSHMKTAKSVLEAVEDNALYSAKSGLDMLASENVKQRMAGLRNVAVFGRAVTFGIQNLKSTEIGEVRFNEWYEAKQEQMRTDPIMKYFVEVRNAIEKQGKVNVSSSMTFSNPQALIQQYPAPPGSKGFFMGDNIGGCGYEVETEGGRIVKYYIDVPDNVPGLQLEMKVHFPDAPDALKNKDIIELSHYYVSALTGLLEEAKSTFLS